MKWKQGERDGEHTGIRGVGVTRMASNQDAFIERRIGGVEGERVGEGAGGDAGKNTDAPIRSCRQFSRPHLSKSTQFRKASSLLRNESRASALFGGPFPAPNFGREFLLGLVLTL